MDSSSSRDMDHAPLHGAGKPAGPDAVARIARLLGHAADLEQLERMLLTYAVHPDGPAFDRVHLLIWDPRSELLIEHRRAYAGRSGASVRVALECARLADTTDSQPEEARARFEGMSPEALEGAPALAFHRGQWAVTAGGVGPWDGAEALGALPLRRRGRTYGVIVGEWLTSGDLERRRGVLENFAALSDTAVTAEERYSENRRLAHHASAIAEIARAAVSPLNLAEVLQRATRLAAQSCGARGSALWRTAADSRLKLEVTHGASGDRERLGRALQKLAIECVAEGRPRAFDRPADEAALPPAVAAELSAIAMIPIVAYGRNLGALAVYDRLQAHPAETEGFDRVDLESLATLADVVAVAIDQSVRFEELRDAERRQRDLQARIRRQDRLSALGEIAVRLAQEARNPLASIRAFARRMHRGLGEADPAREYLEIMLREADRIEKILGEPLAHSDLDLPAFKVESLNEVVQESLQRAGETLVRRRVRLLKKLSPEIPTLLLDPDRIRQVIANILAHALESVSTGGRIRIESRRIGQHALVEISHDGPHSPGEALEQLFAPFAASRAGGPVVGLGVAQRIVREHGGEIRVRSEGEWSTIVTFTIPILENQDRRRVGADRRQVRADRRGPMGS